MRVTIDEVRKKRMDGDETQELIPGGRRSEVESRARLLGPERAGRQGARQSGREGGRPLISPAAIGPANRGRVLQALFDLGPTSRAELARYAQVNRTTISGIVQPLLDRGVLVEGEPLPVAVSGGKPARPLWFSPDAGPICAAMLMPDMAHTALVSLTGDIYAEQVCRFAADPATAEPLIEGLAGCLDRTLAEAARPPLGIGVAVGGMVDTDANSIVAVNLAPALAGYPLGRELGRRFGLTVCLDHHPRAMLLGERWFGIGRGLRTFAAIYTGEVLGGALYLDGHLYRGPGGGGGELGHTFVQLDGDLCRCGRRGCWETIATTGWLRAQARAAGLPEPDAIDAARLAGLAAAGHPGAATLFDRYARNVAVGIANLHQTMSPEVYVLYGDVVGGGATMRDAIAAHVRALVPARPGHELTFALGDTEDRATLRGAAGLVLSETLQFAL
ncbi:MAG: ROK family protein [Alphaproteobacteria bacterium]